MPLIGAEKRPTANVEFFQIRLVRVEFNSRKNMPRHFRNFSRKKLKSDQTI